MESSLLYLQISCTHVGEDFLSNPTHAHSFICTYLLSGSFSVGSIASKMQQLEYEVNVTNTGNVAGDAVVLAFVSGTPPDFPISVIKCLPSLLNINILIVFLFACLTCIWFSFSRKILEF